MRHLPIVSVKYTRVRIVLERALYDALGWLAQREGLSRSTQARDLLRSALETHEDIVLAEIAAERERSLGRIETSSHDAVWPRVAKSKRR